jgi:uncharacterized protein (TIGR01244 family)
MDLHAIDGGLSVTGQIAPGDLPELAAQGFRAVICNRPDGEAAAQPTQGEIAAAAAAAGLAFRFLPIVAGRVNDGDAAAFGAALSKPSHLAWLMKERLLPPVYWRAMLRGREWMAKPEPVAAPAA